MSRESAGQQLVEAGGWGATPTWDDPTWEAAGRAQPSPGSRQTAPHSRQDPVIPHPPPWPPPRLARCCWHQKATFQRPPHNSLPTPDSWQSRGAGAFGRGEGCGGRGLAIPQGTYISSWLTSTPTGSWVWPMAQPTDWESQAEGSVSDKMLFPGVKVPLTNSYQRFSRQSANLLCDLGQDTSPFWASETHED